MWVILDNTSLAHFQRLIETEDGATTRSMQNCHN